MGAPTHRSPAAFHAAASSSVPLRIAASDARTARSAPPTSASHFFGRISTLASPHAREKWPSSPAEVLTATTSAPPRRRTRRTSGRICEASAASPK